MPGVDGALRKRSAATLYPYLKLPRERRLDGLRRKARNLPLLPCGSVRLLALATA